MHFRAADALSLWGLCQAFAKASQLLLLEVVGGFLVYLMTGNAEVP